MSRPRQNPEPKETALPLTELRRFTPALRQAERLIHQHADALHWRSVQVTGAELADACATELRRLRRLIDDAEPTT